MSSAPSLSSLLTPLETNDGVGNWLRYDPVYVTIKDARREEDDGIPRQSWEAELKHANWPEVERLCVDVLSTKSKDLQLAIWLIEARFHIYGLECFCKDIEFLSNFVEAFWEKMYPQKTDDPEQEFRTHIFESFLRKASELILLNPIEELSVFFNQPQTLAKCFEADNLQKKAKTSPAAADAYNKALANGLITMERIRNALGEVESAKGLAKVSIIESCGKYLKQIEAYADKEIGLGGPNFDELLSNLEELKGLYKLCKKALSEKKPDPKIASDLASSDEDAEVTKEQTSTSKTTTIGDRAGAYDAVRKLGDFLLTLEPHSPAPAILKLIGGWESKTFSQILTELQSSPPEIRSLLSLLAQATVKEPSQVAATQAPSDNTFGSNDISQLSNLVPR